MCHIGARLLASMNHSNREKYDAIDLLKVSSADLWNMLISLKRKQKPCWHSSYVMNKGDAEKRIDLEIRVNFCRW